MKHSRVFYSDYWMTSRRCDVDQPQIMGSLADRIDRELFSTEVLSDELMGALTNVGLWISIAVDEDLPAGLFRVVRNRKPPAWHATVVIPFASLEHADGPAGLGLMIDAWKLGLGECFRHIGLSAAESQRVLCAIENIRTNPGDILDI